MPPLPFTPAHIAIGGIYNIRPETQYEALGYETDITLPARHHKVLVIGAAPERLTTVSMNLRLSTSHRLNSRFTNFVPFAPVTKAPYAMQLVLRDGAKFKKDGFLRINQSYFIHGSGLMEEPERFPGKKLGAHLRVVESGETGMERLREVLEEREGIVRKVERGEDVEMQGPEMCG